MGVYPYAVVVARQRCGGVLVYHSVPFEVGSLTQYRARVLGSQQARLILPPVSPPPPTYMLVCTNTHKLTHSHISTCLAFYVGATDSNLDLHAYTESAFTLWLEMFFFKIFFFNYFHNFL